ncbi:DNA polymerase [Western grey kangaroopox virus]|uniref:DNA polymerase n=1 Tax=Western grey kangaroopox virus TaxID=1566307 RepID=A0A2C9DSJ8_9POXV|nr:DNA polymerase [Western grey kangaroopox virus]ATI20981.1 DNA polymerase [Western grey kangaroopox virus]
MELRCINWFENRGEERFLYLKAKTRHSESVFIRFRYYFYHVLDNDVVGEGTLPPQQELTHLGSFNIVPIDELVSIEIANLRRRECFVKDLYLSKDLARRKTRSRYLADFLNITWFFLLHDIALDGCYRVDPCVLVPLGPGCFHCDDPKTAFAVAIPAFEVRYTYLFFDIECQFDRKFPSVFINPVSHVSCCTLDSEGREFRFSLVNGDLLPPGTAYEPLTSADEFSPAQAVTFCSEILLLTIMKRVLEQRFDYVVTFNGNNFDIRYLSGRLEILTRTQIVFRSPDNSEAVKLCIYERFLSSHRGPGGYANKTYHVNNNNGTVFFDLYGYIQKTERLESYKLDSISKNLFCCRARVEAVEAEDLVTFRGGLADNSADRLHLFSEVLETGNYVTVDSDLVHRILHKDIDARSGEFRIHIVRGEGEYRVGETYELAFGKDDVDLRNMYRDYSMRIALQIERYCLHDACLCKYIWNYYRIASKINAASSAYLLPQCLSLEYRASTLIKGPILRLMLNEKIVYVRSVSRTRYPYIGGKVFLPKQKTFENNVMVFDYNSLYPNVCIYANLSPETLVCVVVSSNRLDAELNLRELRHSFPFPDFIHVVCESRFPEGYNEICVYDRRHEGIIPKLLNQFISRRKHYKALLKSASSVIETNLYDSMQYIYKIIANSVYGLMGFSSSALYSYTSAKCCTTIGREMITYLDSVLNGASWTGHVLYLAEFPANIFSGTTLGEREVPMDLTGVADASEALNFRGVYGDTDSIFLEVDTNDVEKTLVVARRMEDIINGKVLYGNFRVEFEAVYSNLILQSKKKYTTTKYPAGFRRGDVPTRVNKGTSETRRDVSRFHKEMIKKYKSLLVELLSKRTPPGELTTSILRSLEVDLVSEFGTSRPCLERYLLSRKHHNNYKLPSHANFELVRRYNATNAEKIEIGERYYYAYVCSRSLPWQKSVSSVQSYEVVVDARYALPTESRVFYEIYFKRLATEIVNLLSDRSQCTLFFSRLFGSRPQFRAD